ncbi:hypothetical protein M4I32_12415 [Microbacterium sp. LRZ72]|uniref:hypothetical protein n=1 Tax=Microbacterium sp. LRZ72 TaxID=2942481 RepID=UPI0029A64DFF|nr:hypothetical protein [Microbacterium sp. LRZ72]MDX2377604.1 hypothetical protein [Microbacterium sp. LRZ72]
MPLNDLLVPLDVDVPDIQPDFSAPFFQGFQVIASYILAGAMIIVFIMLVIAGAALAFRGLSPERVRSWAGENIAWIFIAAAILGAANGLFAWFVNFDFGF